MRSSVAWSGDTGNRYNDVRAALGRHLGFCHTASIYALSNDGDRLIELLLRNPLVFGHLRGKNNLRATLQIKREFRHPRTRALENRQGVPADEQNEKHAQPDEAGHCRADDGVSCHGKTF